MRQTMNARWRHSRWSRIVTNADKPEAESLLHRLAFWVYEQKDELFCSQEDLEADALAGQFGCRLPYDGVLCLIFQIISAEEFELRPADDTPPISWPPEFLLQRNNASALMSDLLKMIRDRGGELWTMWLALVAEMDDRALYDDDVPSPMRRLIRRAHKLPSSTSSVTSVLDDRFIEDRHRFYNTSSHRTGDQDSSEDEPIATTRRKKGRNSKSNGKANVITRGPSELPPWSFLAEGGILEDAEAGIGKFPGSRHINIWEEHNVLAGKRGTLDDKIDEDAPSIHPELEQRERDFRETRKRLEELGDDWATRLEIGNIGHDGCWVGIFDDGTNQYEEDI